MASSPSVSGVRRTAGSWAPSPRRREERALEVEARAAAAPSAGAVGHPARGPGRRTAAARPRGADGAVGRNEVTPAAQQRPGHAGQGARRRRWRRGRPSRGRGRRRSPGAMNGPPAAASSASSGSTAAIQPSSIVTRPATTPSARTRRPRDALRHHDSSAARRASRPRPRTARRARSGPPGSGSRSPRSGGRAHRRSPAARPAAGRRGGSRAAARPRASPPRRRSSPCPRRRWCPPRARASCSDPCSRSAVITRGCRPAQQPRGLDGDRLGRRPAGRGARRRPARTGTMPSAAASSAVHGRISRASTREVGTRPRRSISCENVISRSARRWAGSSATKLPRPGIAHDQALVGEPLHRVACGHPADAELLAQRGVRRERVAGREAVDPLAQRALDPAPVRDRRCGAAHRPAATARSAPCTAAPIAPAQTPSSAGTTVDRVERGRAHATLELGADRREQQLARRGHAAADHDAVGRDHGDHVRDPDAQVAADPGQPLERPRVAGPRAGHGLLGGRRPARRRDPVGARERLDAPVVAAAARRPVRVDRLVPELAGRPVVALDDPAVDRDDAADARAQREADHVPRAAARASRSSASPNARASLIRNARDARGARRPGRRPGRPAQAPGTLTRNRVVPAAGSYSPGTPIADRRHAGHSAIAPGPGLGDRVDHRLGPVRGPGGGLARRERGPGVAVVLDDRPLEVGAAEVQAEVADRRPDRRRRRSAARTPSMASAGARTAALGSTCLDSLAAMVGPRVGPRSTRARARSR